MGGLMILENSHRQEKIKSSYGRIDVDVYCTNAPDAAEIETGQKRWHHADTGQYAKDAVAVGLDLKSRWLTTDYQLGDLLVFGMYTMHASMDNHTNRLRLSTDTRYQLASEPVDELWIGEEPIAHGPEAQKGDMCGEGLGIGVRWAGRPAASTGPVDDGAEWPVPAKVVVKFVKVTIIETKRLVGGPGVREERLRRGRRDDCIGQPLPHQDRHSDFAGPFPHFLRNSKEFDDPTRAAVPNAKRVFQRILHFLPIAREDVEAAALAKGQRGPGVVERDQDRLQEPVDKGETLRL